MVGALSNLGHEVSHQTVANILKRHDIAPAPERGWTTSWREFIRSHMEVLAAVDFFTVEVWTADGWMTCYVLTCMRVASRQIPTTRCIGPVRSRAAWIDLLSMLPMPALFRQRIL